LSRAACFAGLFGGAVFKNLSRFLPIVSSVAQRRFSPCRFAERGSYALAFHSHVTASSPTCPPQPVKAPRMLPSRPGGSWAAPLSSGGAVLVNQSGSVWPALSCLALPFGLRRAGLESS